jgi:hypothetical protein
MSLELTTEALKAAKFRGPTVFGDGAKGMAFQKYECVDDPRFGYEWRRENRKDRGRIRYTVDGDAVAGDGDAGIDEAIAKLKLPPDPNSYAEHMRRYREERAAREAAEAKEP